jgi:alpha-mannosidase
MSISQITILLPCYSLEDLSLDQSSADAEALLAAWSAGYHPALLTATGKIPVWTQAEHPSSDPETLKEAVVLIPQQCKSLVPEHWIDEAREAGAILIDQFETFDDLLPQLLKLVEPDPRFTSDEPIDEQLVDDLFALGLGYLLIELLTRQLRYMSSLDDTQYDTTAICAAEAIMRRDGESARDRLQAGFDLLTEAREYFYPVEAFLFDLTLVAPSTLGPALKNELGQLSTNLLISGQTLKQCEASNPELLEAMRGALNDDRVCLIGGPFEEGPDWLMTRESWLANFHRGLAVYQEVLGTRPVIFGRRQFGLSPILPDLLSELDFEGALHFTFGQGAVPASYQSKIDWEGGGPGSIPALARTPLSAEKSRAIFRLPERLGDSLDFDHAATLVFAHWPGMTSRWYRLVSRIDRYSPALGRFVSAKNYFENTLGTGQSNQWGADDYRSPFLKQTVGSGGVDPIGRLVRYHRRTAAIESLRTLIGLERAVSGNPGADYADKLECLSREVESEMRSDAGLESTDNSIDGLLREAKENLARAIGATPAEPGDEKNRDVLCFNSLSGPQAALGQAGQKIELPAFGFAVEPKVSEQESKPAQAEKRSLFGLGGRKGRTNPPLVEELNDKESHSFVVRNQFFEAVVDPITGALKSMHDYTHRSNRLAEQIALRMPESDRGVNGDEETAYTIMAADRITIDSSDRSVGRLDIEGRLVDRLTGKAVARFEKSLIARSGSRVLEIEIGLTPERMPEGNPWDSYYAARFAWNDATADLYRDVGQAAVQTEADILESPRFVDVRSEKLQTSILTGGLTFHRRFGLRKMDTLLIVPGETTRRFRLGIGIDLPSVVRAGEEFLAPQLSLPIDWRPQADSGWLVHLDRRNTLATRLEPLVGSEGTVDGFRVRLLETEGRPTEVGLSTFRPLVSATRTNFLDEEQGDPLSIDAGRAIVELEPYEWAQFHVRWNG